MGVWALAVGVVGVEGGTCAPMAHRGASGTAAVATRVREEKACCSPRRTLACSRSWVRGEAKGAGVEDRMEWDAVKRQTRYRAEVHLGAWRQTGRCMLTLMQQQRVGAPR